METVFLFCNHAQAGPDNNLNIYGVFNELYAPDFPARQDRLVLAGVIEWDGREEGRIDFRIDLLDPDGSSIFTVDGHTDVAQGSPSHSPPKSQFVLPMEKVLFPGPGRYRIKLAIDGEQLNGPSLYLMRRDQASGA